MLSIPILLFCQLAPPSVLKIAVLDTGYNYSFDSSLCPKGHFDFHRNKPGIGRDNRLHGTRSISLIKQLAGKNPYCLVVYKIFDDAYTYKTIVNIEGAIEAAIREKVDIIHLTFSGIGKSGTELQVLEKATRLGIKVFVSAGNERADLDRNCNIYPACYKIPRNFYIVGAYRPDGLKWDFTNHGRQINIWTLVPRRGVMNFGTSAATSITVGVYIAYYFSNKKDNACSVYRYIKYGRN